MTIRLVIPMDGSVRKNFWEGYFATLHPDPSPTSYPKYIQWRVYLDLNIRIYVIVKSTEFHIHFDTEEDMLLYQMKYT